MMWSGLLLLASGLGAAGAPAHPNSFSISELHVWNGRVEVQLRCQVLSLGEVIEGLDPELDGHAEPGELDRFAVAPGKGLRDATAGETPVLRFPTWPGKDDRGVRARDLDGDGRLDLITVVDGPEGLQVQFLIRR